MLRKTVERISNQFIAEAIASPNLLADMASMEKYMAESYSGRVFVELLQNADDCNSTTICVKEFDGHIIFANNGRPFDENDIISISRSGSSNKKRGESIGYRGIGFKSTTYLTEETIIYSNNIYFTFSKRLCSDRISIPLNKIPMIRIPILLDTVDSSISYEVQLLVEKGYNTVFVFKDAKIQEFLEEIQQINNSLFIFLNHVEQCYIEMDQFKSNFSLHRYTKDNGQIVSFDDDNIAWYILRHNGTAIALKYDVENNKIITCNDNERLYHSYLPTFDKMIFPIKVNADFSTDPSRKHVFLDEKTDTALQSIGENIAYLIRYALYSNSLIDFSDIFTILNDQGEFSRCNSVLKQYVKDNVLHTVFLTLRNGAKISIDQYKLFPGWLAESEKQFLRMESEYIGQFSLEKNVYVSYPNVDSFILSYSNNQFSNNDFISLMTDLSLVEKMTMEMQGKIFGHIIRSSRFDKMTSEKENTLDDIIVSTNDGFQSIKEIRLDDYKLLNEVQEGLKNVASRSDLNWFCEKKSMDVQKLITTREIPVSHESIVKNEKKEIRPYIPKWRSAEQQCVEIEKYFGNTALDVSKKNLGYDIESTTPDGMKRYIEVKLINKNGGFSITNNEYTAAYHYGDLYYVCLLIQNNQSVQAIYIRNPIKSISFEKRIKQWEWYCDSYEGDVYIFER